MKRTVQLRGLQESLIPRTLDEGDDKASFTAEPTSTAAAGMRQPDATPQLRRKRKPETISSSMEPSKFRTRSMIIVYYDSAVQEAFEGVVRNISIARNNLRKGKMAAKMKQMTAMHEAIPLGDDVDAGVLGTRLAFARMARMRGAGGGAGGAAPEEKSVFDKIDQILEAAQNLSEHGAHQFLRDGDCSSEISGIKSRLAEVGEMAKEELERQAAVDSAEVEKTDPTPDESNGDHPQEDKEDKEEEVQVAAKTSTVEQSLEPDVSDPIEADASGEMEVDPDY